MSSENAAPNSAPTNTNEGERQPYHHNPEPNSFESRQPLYTPKNILLTGGSGFIGCHVLNYLVKKYPNYNFVNFDVVDYCATERNHEESQGKKNFAFVKGDIQDEALVAETFRKYGIDTVIHFAAQSHVDLSFTHSSVEFTRTNVVGTHILLEAARRNNIKRFVHVSTDEVYGEVDFKADEKTVLNPTNPYSCSKAAAEIMASAYMKSYHLPVVISRSNNVYGPKQYPEKVIPKFICRLLRGQKCCLHGNGNTCRNFIYVDDVVTAFDCILHHGKDYETYNIGTDEDVKVLELSYQLVKDLIPDCKDPKEWIEYVEDRKYNDFRYSLDFKKLQELGWHPQVSFAEGLKKTEEWYKTHHENHWGDITNALSPHSWKAYDYQDEPLPTATHWFCV